MDKLEKAITLLEQQSTKINDDLLEIQETMIGKFCHQFNCDDEQVGSMLLNKPTHMGREYNEHYHTLQGAIEAENKFIQIQSDLR